MKKIYFLFFVILFSCEQKPRNEDLFKMHDIVMSGRETYRVDSEITKTEDGCITFKENNNQIIVCGSYSMIKR